MDFHIELHKQEACSEHLVCAGTLQGVGLVGGVGIQYANVPFIDNKTLCSFFVADSEASAGSRGQVT